MTKTRWLHGGVSGRHGGRPLRHGVAAALLLASTSGCRQAPPADRLRVSGYVEATDVRVAPEVGGRILEVLADEGSRVTKDQVIATLDTTDTSLAIRRLEAEREQAEAQLRLLLAGS